MTLTIERVRKPIAGETCRWPGRSLRTLRIAGPGAGDLLDQDDRIARRAGAARGEQAGTAEVVAERKAGGRERAGLHAAGDQDSGQAADQRGGPPAARSPGRARGSPETAPGNARRGSCGRGRAGAHCRRSRVIPGSTRPAGSGPAAASGRARAARTPLPALAATPLRARRFPLMPAVTLSCTPKACPPRHACQDRRMASRIRRPPGAPALAGECHGLGQQPPRARVDRQAPVVERDHARLVRDADDRGCGQPLPQQAIERSPPSPRRARRSPRRGTASPAAAGARARPRAAAARPARAPATRSAPRPAGRPGGRGRWPRAPAPIAARP